MHTGFEVTSLDVLACASGSDQKSLCHSLSGETIKLNPLRGDLWEETVPPPVRGAVSGFEMDAVLGQREKFTP